MAGEIKGLPNAPPTATTPRAASSTTGTSTAPASSAGARPIDQIIFTDAAVSLQRLDSFIRGLPVTDGARVGVIREQVADGRYQIDDARVADKFIKFELLYHRASSNDGYQASA